MAHVIDVHAAKLFPALAPAITAIVTCNDQIAPTSNRHEICSCIFGRQDSIFTAAAAIVDEARIGAGTVWLDEDTGNVKSIAQVRNIPHLNMCESFANA